MDSRHSSLWPNYSSRPHHQPICSLQPWYQRKSFNRNTTGSIHWFRILCQSVSSSVGHCQRSNLGFWSRGNWIRNFQNVWIYNDLICISFCLTQRSKLIVFDQQGQYIQTADFKDQPTLANSSLGRLSQKWIGNGNSDGQLTLAGSLSDFNTLVNYFHAETILARFWF